MVKFSLFTLFFISVVGVGVYVANHVDQTAIQKERAVTQKYIIQRHPDATFPQTIEGEFNRYNDCFVGYYMIGDTKVEYRAKVKQVGKGDAYYLAEYQEKDCPTLYGRDWSVVFGPMYD